MVGRVCCRCNQWKSLYEFLLKNAKPDCLIFTRAESGYVEQLNLDEVEHLELMFTSCIKLRLTVENGSQGQSLLVFMPREYIKDFAMYYRGAKRLIPKNVLQSFPSPDMERHFVYSRTRSVASFLLEYLGTETRPDTFLVGLTVKTFVSLLLSPKEVPKNNPHISEHSEKLEEVIALVLSDLSEFLGIRRLARKMHVNTNPFKKMFALKTGSPPLRFWQNKRMESAYELLPLKNTRPSEVADILGYSSLHAFDKAFKKYFGVAPSEIIQKER
ncbi:MAG: AraC family transcriptional regulator [Arachidicoccus sp.]|nr:AraC family transcriptional regulator [Arachidicoccus sp.]